MAKRGGNRLVYQTEQALKSIKRFNSSKRDARKVGEKWIHSVSAIEKALSVSQNFTKWAKEQGVKDLYQLKRSHYRDYLKYKQAEGVSNGHLINIETNLRLLQRGMEQISIEKGLEPRKWIPSKRLIDVSEREKPQNRSLTMIELKEAQKRLSESAQEAKTLEEAFGVRIRELSRSTTHYIEEHDGKLYWIASDKPGALNPAKGVTKGGRPRIAPCDPSKEFMVRRLLEERKEGEYLTKIRYNGIKSAYQRAGVHGSHAFRHTYARNMMRKELKERGIGADQARATLEKYIEIKDFGNNSKKMEQLKVTKEFQDLRICMDKVHGYLGHGEGRMDLARVYIAGF